MHVSNIHISSGTAELNLNRIIIKHELSNQERLDRSCRSKDINFISDDSYTSFREKNKLHDEVASIHNIRVIRKIINDELIPELKSNKHGYYYDAMEKIWHLLPLDKSGPIFKDNTRDGARFIASNGPLYGINNHLSILILKFHVNEFDSNVCIMVQS